MVTITLEITMRTKDRYCKTLFVLLICIATASCQQAMHAASRSPIKAQSASQTVVQSLNQIVESENDADKLRFNLCSTEPGRFKCTGDAPHLKGKDFGLMPVTLSVDAIELQNLSAGANGWAGNATLKLKVNGIDLWCRRGNISALINPAGRVETSLDSTFCNWLLLGNAIIEMQLSIEELDLRTRSVACFYTLQAKGTTRAEASGYFMARADDTGT